MPVRTLRLVYYHRYMRLEDGGVVRAVLDWCRVLAARGHNVTLVTCDPQDVPETWREQRAGCPRLLVSRCPGADPRVRACIQHADALHIHELWDPRNLGVTALARRLGVPYLITLHGVLDDWSMRQKRLKKQLYMSFAGRRLLDAAARVHCAAEGELTQARRRLGRSPTIVLPLLVDLAPYVELPGPDLARRTFELPCGDGPLVLFLSRLHHKKGLELLLQAAAALRRQGVAVRLLVAGTGTPRYEESLRRLAAQCGLDGHVHFLGLVAGASKYSLYQLADVLVLPTSQENFGLVLIEALACGTPVVTTKGVDIWPALQSAGAAIVEPTSEAIAVAIRSLMTDPTRLAELRREGRRWVLREFDLERLAGAYEQLFEDIVAERCTTAARTALRHGPAA